MQAYGRPYQAIICRQQTRPATVWDIQTFRKRLFVDHLGWQLPTAGGREIDDFDTANAVHSAIYRQGRLVGTFRAIPTLYPYLSATVFPHLATALPFPRRADIWEISRFGVDPEERGIAASLLTYAVMIRFAQLRRASSLVAVVDLGHERLLSKIGITTRRYGRPGNVGVDRFGRVLHGVAGEIPIAAQNSDGFRTMMKLLDQVEIQDETLVFGRQAVPA